MNQGKDKPCDVKFTDACMEELTSSQWLKKYGKSTCKFVCFSRQKAGKEIEYRVSFFFVDNGPTYLEVVGRGKPWDVEGGGLVSPNVMKRCGEGFAAWSGDKFLDKDKKYPGYPKDEVLAREIKLAIEKFCLSGLVTIKFVDSHGNDFEEVGREDLGKMNLNFVCSISPKTDIYTVTIFVRDNDFPHTAIVDRLMCKDEKTTIVGGGIAFFDSRDETKRKYTVIWSAPKLINWGHPDRPKENGLKKQLLKKISNFLKD